ncbi:HEAT repeat-containing protein 1, partial [Halocaridina rubra]
QLLMCLYEFTEKSPSKSCQVIDSILNVIRDDIPMHIRMALLYAISCVMDAKLLSNLLPLAETVFNLINALKAKASLEVASSYTFYYILLRFTPDTSDVLESENGWHFFQNALACSLPVMNIKNEFVSPQKVLMEQVMSQKFLASIKKEEVQARLWGHLISCVAESECPNEASRLRNGLRKTCLDASVVVNQIKQLDLVQKTKSMREARVKRIKQKEKKDKLMNWKKLGLMLETIGIMATLTRPWLLTSILCQCLQQTLDMETVITELVQQQILSALLHLLQKSREELGRDVSKNVTVNVELIVHCIRSSVSPDTHRRAMLILALAADIFPESVLHNMMSIFTFMGTSLLRRDDSYSFQVIHQTIQSIVPTLLK